MKALHINWSRTHRLTFIYCPLIFVAQTNIGRRSSFFLYRQQHVIPFALHYALAKCLHPSSLRKKGQKKKRIAELANGKKHSNCENKSRARWAPLYIRIHHRGLLSSHKMFSPLCADSQAKKIFIFWAKTTFSRKFANYLFIYCFRQYQINCKCFVFYRIALSLNRMSRK